LACWRLLARLHGCTAAAGGLAAACAAPAAATRRRSRGHRPSVSTCWRRRWSAVRCQAWPVAVAVVARTTTGALAGQHDKRVPALPARPRPSWPGGIFWRQRQRTLVGACLPTRMPTVTSRNEVGVPNLAQVASAAALAGCVGIAAPPFRIVRARAQGARPSGTGVPVPACRVLDTQGHHRAEEHVVVQSSLRGAQPRPAASPARRRRRRGMEGGAGGCRGRRSQQRERQSGAAVCIPSIRPCALRCC
jgi:hypothetical protein